MCLVWCYFCSILPKLSVLVIEYQYLYLCDTHDNAKHSILLYSVWHSKNAQFSLFFLRLCPILCVGLFYHFRFFRSFDCSFVLSVCVCVSVRIAMAKQQHILRILPNCHWPILPSVRHHCRSIFFRCCN